MGGRLLEHALHVLQNDIHSADEKSDLARQNGVAVVVGSPNLYIGVVPWAIVDVLLDDGLL